MEVGLDETQGCEPVESVQGRILYMSEKTTSSAVRSGSGTLSIIVPVYNVEAYLDTCVRSLLAQTYRHLEIILIDDGSPDGCPARCDAWAARDARVRVIHSANGGVSHARNLGLDAARGEVIGFCDADDWVEPDYYARMVQAMHETGAEVVEGGYIRDDGEHTYMRLKPAQARVYSRDEAFAVMFCHKAPKAFWWELCDKIFSRDVIGDLRLDEHIAASEDMLLTGQIMLRVKRLAFVPLYGYHYLVRPGSATQGGATQEQSDTSSLALEYLHACVAAHGSPAMRRTYAKFWRYGLHSRIRYLLRQPDTLKRQVALHAAQSELRQHLPWIICAHLAQHHIRGVLGAILLALPLGLVKSLGKWL